MIILALGCAVLAALLGVKVPASRGLQARLGEAHLPSRGRWTHLLVLGAALVSVVLVVLGGAVIAGARGAVLVVAALAVTGVTGWLVRQRVQLRTALRAQDEVAHACSVLASHLRVGQVPTEALAVASVDCAVLREARQVHDVGGDVTAVWRVQGCQPGHGGLLELARAWQVSVQTGAPLSATLQQVAVSLSAEESLRAVVAGELASPRATSKVMAALPACGIGMGYLLGGDPIQWLLAGPAGWACVLGGVFLAGAGVIWIELLARQASRPEMS